MVLESHHLLPLITDNQFDTVRHERLSLGAVERIVEPLGLTVVAARPAPVFGGSLQVHPRRLACLQTSARRCAEALHEQLSALAAAGRTVVGYGAKAPVLLDLSGIGRDLLPFTVDLSPAKHGRRIPGCGIPIRPVADLHAALPDVVLVLTMDIVDEVSTSRLAAVGGRSTSSPCRHRTCSPGARHEGHRRP